LFTLELLPNNTYTASYESTALREHHHDWPWAVSFAGTVETHDTNGILLPLSLTVEKPSDFDKTYCHFPTSSTTIHFIAIPTVEGQLLLCESTRPRASLTELGPILLGFQDPALKMYRAK
jgi:hypothetical protein